MTYFAVTAALAILMHKALRASVAHETSCLGTDKIRDT